MSQSDEIKVSSLVPSSQEKVLYCNLLTGFENRSFLDNITIIKSLPNLLGNFPNVNRYVTNLGFVTYATVFRFNFCNIHSYMLFLIQEESSFEDLESSPPDLESSPQELESFLQNSNFLLPDNESSSSDESSPPDEPLPSQRYYFMWIISDASFSGEKIEAMGLYIKYIEEGLVCEISDIATKDFIIPPLVMNGKTYTKMAVPMLLALNLSYCLGFDETFLHDIAHKTIDCRLDELGKSGISFFILDERLMTCRASIYGKYGFEPEYPLPRNLLCTLTLQEIIDDYKMRFEHIGELEAYLKTEEKFIAWSSSIEDIIADFAAAAEIIDSLNAEPNRNLTLKQYLEMLPDGNRNCRVVMLKSLTGSFLWEKFTYKGVTYPELRFSAYYNQLNQRTFVNTNIGETLRYIYLKGLPDK